MDPKTDEIATFVHSFRSQWASEGGKDHFRRSNMHSTTYIGAKIKAPSFSKRPKKILDWMKQQRTTSSFSWAGREIRRGGNLGPQSSGEEHSSDGPLGSLVPSPHLPLKSSNHHLTLVRPVRGVGVEVLIEIVEAGMALDFWSVLSNPDT